MAFDLSLGGKTLLEVAFDIDAHGPLPGAVNLWFEGASPVRNDSEERPSNPRKYVPLLGAGNAPGSHVRRFAPDAACFPTWMAEQYGCRGSRGPGECGACQGGDTCGDPGDECGDLDFSRPSLQLALEFCGDSNPEPEVVIDVQEVAFLSLGCLLSNSQ